MAKCLVKHNLNDEIFLSEFECNYFLFLLSKYGPRSSSSLISNSFSCETLTSSSSQLVTKVPFSHPCCKYINALIKAQNNTFYIHGLYVGVLCSGLLIHCLRLENSVPRPFIKNVMSCIHSSYFEYLCETVKGFSYKICVGKIEEVLCIVNAIINSKCLPHMSSAERNHVNLRTVEAFLKTIPSDQCHEFGNVFVKNVETTSLLDSKIVDGILYQEIDLDHTQIDGLLKKLNSVDSLNIILLSFKLEVDYGEPYLIEHGNLELRSEDIVLEDMFALIMKVVNENRIAIVACQMCVHPFLKHTLSKEGLLVLERLGTVGVNGLVKVSGSCPISSLSEIQSGPVDRMIGRVSSVSKVEIEDKLYLNLTSSRESQDVTFLLTVRDQHVFEFMKDSINSCINVLRKMVKDSSVLPGGGCFETFACAALLKFKNEKMNSWTSHKETSSSKVFSSVADVFLRLAVVCAAGINASISDYCVDFSTFHLWAKNDENEISDFCSCRLVNKCKLPLDADFIGLRDFKSLFGDFSCQSELQLRRISNVSFDHHKPFVLVDRDSVLDILPSKLNALRFALNGFSELYKIGVCIYDQ